MDLTFFDIETGPLPDPLIAHLVPDFSAPANYKNPEAIEGYIAQKKREWFDNAALSAVTGKVLCIGMVRSNGSMFDVLDDDNEAVNIEDFWSCWRDDFRNTKVFVGFNIKGFDLPFLIRRSWYLGLDVPPDVRPGRYWNDYKVLDLMDVWQLGQPQDRISLDNAAKYFGIGEKLGDGKDFWKWWSEDRAKALEYLENDLLLTVKLAEKIGAVSFVKKQGVIEASV